MSRALRAAVEVGTACGIRMTEPAPLQETNNTVVWLRPSTAQATDRSLSHSLAALDAALVG